MPAVSLLIVLLPVPSALLLPLVWHCKSFKRLPPTLTEAAAPPTATSNSPFGLLSLSDNLGILQLLPLFFLATFWNTSSCLHCSNSKKSLRQSLLLLNFLTSKHGKVVQYGYIYIKYLEVASMHFDYAAQLALQEN